MAKYINSDIKAVGVGDNIGIDIPKPIASISFDVPYAGTYVVNVKQDGSYSATFNNVWVVTYLDENNEPQLMVFDNPLAADACYKHFYKNYKKYRNDVWIDKCEVYGSFMVAGNEDE